MDHYYSAPKTLLRLRKGPLAPYIVEFAKDLWRKGYALITARYKIRLIGKLARWLEQREVDPGDLNRKIVALSFRSVPTVHLHARTDFPNCRGGHSSSIAKGSAIMDLCDILWAFGGYWFAHQRSQYPESRRCGS